jgi:hypothetical protein
MLHSTTDQDVAHAIDRLAEHIADQIAAVVPRDDDSGQTGYTDD